MAGGARGEVGGEGGAEVAWHAGGLVRGVERALEAALAPAGGVVAGGADHYCQRDARAERGCWVDRERDAMQHSESSCMLLGGLQGEAQYDYTGR